MLYTAWGKEDLTAHLIRPSCVAPCVSTETRFWQAVKGFCCLIEKLNIKEVLIKQDVDARAKLWLRVKKVCKKNKA